VAPVGLTLDSGGALYVTDVDNDRIVKLDSQGKLIAVWGSQGSGDNQFVAPWSIAVDVQGNLYVADAGNGRVQKFRQPTSQ
jgi:tripartite motif-containing protein 71